MSVFPQGSLSGEYVPDFYFDHDIADNSRHIVIANTFGYRLDRNGNHTPSTVDEETAAYIYEHFPGLPVFASEDLAPALNENQSLFLMSIHRKHCLRAYETFGAQERLEISARQKNA